MKENSNAARKGLSGCRKHGKKIYEEDATWGDAIRLRITYYLNRHKPPSRFVSSVRAMVFLGDSVLVVRQPDGGLHVIPGGRVEPGESMPQTLRREILEETGWTLAAIRLFACIHLHHLSVKPPEYPYPYPDFLWPVYLAEARLFQPQARVPDEFVSETFFLPIDDVQKTPLENRDLALLEAALESRGANASESPR